MKELRSIIMGQEEVRFRQLSPDTWAPEVPMSDREKSGLLWFCREVSCPPDSFIAMTGVTIMRLIDRTNDDAVIAVSTEAKGRES